MKLLLIALVAAGIAGCGPSHTRKITSGEKNIGARLVLNLEGPWNLVAAPGPTQTWTMDGLPIDQLMIYSGVKDGQIVYRDSTRPERKDVAFYSNMQPEDIVALFEGMLTGSDRGYAPARRGSSFTLVKMEPANFGGEKGLRFEYSLLRKVDNVQLSGVAYAAISKGELFAIVYSAPQLWFFPRNQTQVEQIARSARIKL